MKLKQLIKRPPYKHGVLVRNSGSLNNLLTEERKRGKRFLTQSIGENLLVVHMEALRIEDKTDSDIYNIGEENENCMD